MACELMGDLQAAAALGGREDDGQSWTPTAWLPPGGEAQRTALEQSTTLALPGTMPSCHVPSLIVFLHPLYPLPPLYQLR